MNIELEKNTGFFGEDCSTGEGAKSGDMNISEAEVVGMLIS